jgi:transposase-like protein
MAMASYNRLTEDKFNAVKVLLKGGANTADISRYMGVSASVIGNIKRFATFDDYMRHNAERKVIEKQIAERKRLAEEQRIAEEKRIAEEQRIAEAKAAEARKAAEAVGAVPAAQIVPKQTETTPAEIIKEIRQTVTVQATHYMESELKKCVELLTGIYAKLAFIIDDLCGVKSCGADDKTAK